MGDEVREKRSWRKCSACRERKIKCEPEKRNWEENKERCLSCEERGEECGQSYKKKDDPGLPRPRLANAGSLEVHPRSTVRRSTVTNIAAAPAIRVGALADHHTGVTPFGGPQQGESGLPIRTGSGGEGHIDPSSRLNRLNELGVLSSYFESHLAILSKQGYCSSEPYIEFSNLSSLVKDEFHTLFIQLVDTGLEAEGRATNNQLHSDSAHLIFQRLLFALATYAGPCDERKRHALLKTASYFQRHGHIPEGEHILSRLAEIKHLKLPNQQNPCHLLAQSMSRSSESARSLLADIWQNGYGRGEVPAHLVLPPSQRAALHSNKEVASAVLSSLTNINSPLDILALHDLHIAAARGLTEQVNVYAQTGAFVDPPDAFQRTPLFLAAMHGHDDACLSLLSCGADLKSRDIYGRTILEAAARGGHLSTVQRLLAWGAEVNPEGESTPLQAAVEHTHNIQLIHLLLEAHALVGIQRARDRKSAIDLAEDRGWPWLAHFMREKLQAPASIPQHQAQPFPNTGDWDYFTPGLF
ncbi:hypothetical protein MMC30_002633 [Trapelia coarctata]|nr:hypothetical protein [Trapelia coarctata]